MLLPQNQSLHNHTMYIYTCRLYTSVKQKVDGLVLTAVSFLVFLYFVTGNTEVGPRFDKQGTFLPHSVLGPTHDYASQLKNTAAVSLTLIHLINTYARLIHMATPLSFV